MCIQHFPYGLKYEKGKSREENSSNFIGCFVYSLEENFYLQYILNIYDLKTCIYIAEPFQNIYIQRIFHTISYNMLILSFCMLKEGKINHSGLYHAQFLLFQFRY